MQGQPFAPGETHRVEVGSQFVYLSVDSEVPLLRVLNRGSDLVFLDYGTAPFKADHSQLYPIVPGLPELITKGIGADRVALIGIKNGDGLATVYLTTGTGG